MKGQRNPAGIGLWRSKSRFDPLGGIRAKRFACIAAQPWEWFLAVSIEFI
jgi:hypothetical protein